MKRSASKSKTNKQVMLTLNQIEMLQKIAEQRAADENKFISFSQIIRDCVDFYIKNIDGSVVKHREEEALEDVIISVNKYADHISNNVAGKNGV